MPTLVEFSKINVPSADMVPENLKWQAFAMVNANVIESPRRIVPHYAFGGTYIEAASCPPPLFASANLTCRISDALSLIAIMSDSNNFKLLRLHGFNVRVLKNDSGQMDELLILPQYVNFNIDFNVPDLASISLYGPVQKQQTVSGKTQDFDFETNNYSAYLLVDNDKITSIETLNMRVNFIQDLVLTSQGPYLRCFGIQAPDITISGITTDKFNPNDKTIKLVIQKQQIPIVLTNFSYEPIAGFNNIIRFTIQALITGNTSA